MHTYLDCLPCFLAQALAACKFLGLSKKHSREILNEVALSLPKIDLSLAPPESSKFIYRLIEKKAGLPDPYLTLKKECNALALKVYSVLKQKVASAEDPLAFAILLAGTGNIIDYGALRALNPEKEVELILKNMANQIELDNQFYVYQSFSASLAKASSLLYLLDNAGEIVFDRILIEEILAQFSSLKITAVVRGAPIINDCLLDDAKEIELDKIVPVISNGADAPGTILKLCSKPFLKAWQEHELVLAKGQGNYEGLSEESKDIFFLLTVKCQVLANHLGVPLKKVVLLKNKN